MTQAVQSRAQAAHVDGVFRCLEPRPSLHVREREQQAAVSRPALDLPEEGHQKLLTRKVQVDADVEEARLGGSLLLRRLHQEGEVMSWSRTASQPWQYLIPAKR